MLFNYFLCCIAPCQVDQGELVLQNASHNQIMRPHCLPTLAGPELPLFIPSQVMRSNEDKSAILHGCVGALFRIMTSSFKSQSAR